MTAALPSGAYVAALAGLTRLGPARLRHLLTRWPAEEAWERVRRGAGHLDPSVPGGRWLDPAVGEAWRRQAVTVDVAALWQRHREHGVVVAAAGDAGYPSAFIDDPEPPAVVFHRGVPTAGPMVGVVGTRRCTHAGRSLARQLGFELAAAGVTVVSGLALGIDGAAHAGALAAGAAPPVGVVATGLDVVYPRPHADLWADVAEAGWLLSEYPLGTGPEPWRFPARNRLIAALADVLVVVESHSRGGSLHTVEAAIERGTTVMAVPGSVRSPAAAGTNELLAAGCPPARDAADVLVALGLEAGARQVPAPVPGAAPEAAARFVLDAVGDGPVTLEQVALRTCSPLGPVAVHLQRLVDAGHVVEHDGWFERA